MLANENGAPLRQTMAYALLRATAALIGITIVCCASVGFAIGIFFGLLAFGGVQ